MRRTDPLDNDTLRDDSHISSPTGWIARSPRDNIIYEVDELYSLSRVDPITLFEITDHTDNFFYPKIKVTPVATEGFLGGEKCAHPRKNLVPDIPQKKFQTQGGGSLVGCCLWGRTGSDTTEAI